MSALPDRLLVGTIAGFDGFGIASAEPGFSDHPLFGSLGGNFSVVPIYFEHDCLRKQKMAIFSILVGRVKILYIF